MFGAFIIEKLMKNVVLLSFKYIYLICIYTWIIKTRCMLYLRQKHITVNYLLTLENNVRRWVKYVIL